MPTNDHDDDATLPNLPHAANDETKPNATSPGNEDARGSRGEANSGARPENSTNGGNRDERAPQKGNGPDLRRTPGQGGGGLSSESSRSED